MTVYGFLLVWAIAIMFLSSMFVNFTYSYDKYEGKVVRSKWLVAILAFLPVIIAAGMRQNVGDTGIYRNGFLELSGDISGIGNIIVNTSKDKGFAVLQVLIKAIIGNNATLFFLLIAAFQGGCILAVYKKYSCDFAMSLFLFIASADYISWMFNGMRQFIAVTITFASTGLVLKRKYIPAVALTLLAATIHASALIVLPIIFIVRGKAWNKRTVFVVASIVLLIAMFDRFTPILENLLQNTQYDGVMGDELWITDDGTSFFRTLVYSIPAILSVICLKFIRNEDDPIVNLATNMSIVSAFLYVLSSFTSGIYIGRLPIYFSLYGYILLPWLIRNCFTERSAKLVKIGMVFSYICYYYYQMCITWSFDLFK